jgi:predicted lactoylglutathione lyase
MDPVWEVPMNTKIFVNLPVKDLKKTITFFEALGYGFNPQFSNENGACLIISDTIYAMLLVEPFYQSFTKKEIADATRTSEVILALTAESREAVDDLVKKAFAAGAKPHNEAEEQDFMYGWGFEDLDGHLWEVFYMDESAVQAQA